MNLGPVLVANRGEIARRIFRTCREMGLPCLAVYVDADADAPFVKDADDAIRLPTSYLDSAAVIAAARAVGAQMIHPGYGFLSENAGFARAVQAAGLVWVGPDANVILAMADKLTAKHLAVEADVPILPSSDDPLNPAEVAFPLLVKAAAGGGGKGMRVVASRGDLSDSVTAARREAFTGFGDDRVFIERYVARARHVEIQILGDMHGGLVHLGERECSIQRRHQKIIEESPSPGISAEVRKEMVEAALRLARMIGYSSAGTIEMLVDVDTGNYYFLEVNTRLQVEHPVTEAVTGIDLVREQLRIAAGAPLGYGQEAITFTGHAVEARLYAEDPEAGFLPATGTLAAFQPADVPVVRWEAGVAAGSIVGVEFDPMLAKIIAHAPTRAEAAGKLASALELLHIAGMTTNRDFLANTLRNPVFLSGGTTTDFIERVAPDRSIRRSQEELLRCARGATLWLQGLNRASAPVLHEAPSGWRNARLPEQRVTMRAGESTFDLRYRRRRDGSFEFGDTIAEVRSWSTEHIDAEIGGRRLHGRVTRVGEQVSVQAARGTVEFTIVPRFIPSQAMVSSRGFTTPMPAVVIEIRCRSGDDVVAGELLVVLEAMKMEHQMRAPYDCRVTHVLVSVGQQLQKGAELLTLEPAGGARD